MSTMNISLPQPLKSFVDDQVSTRGYSTSSEYVRALIRKDQGRQSLRTLLLDGGGVATCGHSRRGLLRRAPREGLRSQVTVPGKPVVLRERARRDVDAAVEHYRAEAGPEVTRAFIAALGRCPPPDQ